MFKNQGAEIVLAASNVSVTRGQRRLHYFPSKKPRMEATIAI
jgi:hypothetical protein